LKKAGTTILVATLVVWALSYFPNGTVLTSYLGMVGKFSNRWGNGWACLACAGGPADQFYRQREHGGTLGVLYGNLNVLKTVMTPAAMLAFLVFQILFIPCVGTVAAIQQETKSWKWTLTSVGMQLALSLGLAVAVFRSAGYSKMLHRFLDTIQAGDVQSLMEIAHKLDISPAMVLQMAKQLTEKGYLQEIGSDCDEPQPGVPIAPSIAPAR